MLDSVSDAVDDVNILKLKNNHAFDTVSEFDANKDKENFRQYEAACDRVKGFYAVSGGDVQRDVTLFRKSRSLRDKAGH